MLISISIGSSSLLLGQNSYDENYELELSDCFMSKLDDADLLEHLSKCMLGVDFQYFCVEDINNKEYCSSDFDDYHLINYWFEACPPCKVEKKYLARLSNKFPKLKIISLSKDPVASFERLDISNPSWICVPSYADKKINNNRYGYPLSILLDRKGKIVQFFLGGIVSDSKYNIIDSFLADKKLSH